MVSDVDIVVITKIPPDTTQLVMHRRIDRVLGLRTFATVPASVPWDTAAMTDLLDRVMRLWADPPADDAAAVAAFRHVYADPVPINGVDMTAASW